MHRKGFKSDWALISEMRSAAIRIMQECFRVGGENQGGFVGKIGQCAICIVDIVLRMAFVDFGK